jgi:hypothetical protein
MPLKPLDNKAKIWYNPHRVGGLSLDLLAGCALKEEA